MKRKILFLSVCAAFVAAGQVGAEDISVRITKKYLNLPVSHQVDRAVMTFEVGGVTERTFDIRLAAG
ncbi:MAG: 2,6-beta-D-fructofuranosidase, partial [Tannerella sp.]|nr:2,6-beta-D-fructofuranosidase [Tannerella sp.]